jgi:uncharacterized phage-associated protein
MERQAAPRRALQQQPISPDVAEYILTRLGPTPATKLQKLVYYSQAWSLVWDDRAMISDPFQAWANGPVAPALYARHRRQYLVETVRGNLEVLDDTARETIDVVLNFYGDKSSQWLSDLTHAEAPWRIARGNLPPGASCEEEISLADMAEYYGSL